MGSKNPVSEYLEDMLYFLRHSDEEGLAALQREGAEKYVTLEDVGSAFFEVVTEFAEYVDMSQAITEARMKAIVSALPEETQTIIHAMFVEAEDDLFTEELTINEGEEEYNG